MFKRNKQAVLGLTVITILVLGAAIYVQDQDQLNSKGAAKHLNAEQPLPEMATINPRQTEQTSEGSSTDAQPEERIQNPVSEDDELSDTDMQMRLAGLPTPDEAKQGNELSKKWGYFSEEEREVYRTYSDETLNALGEEGDLLALDILLERAMRNYENDPEKADALLEKAAVYGSTPAAMGKALGASIFADMHKKDSAEYRDAMRESLAWYQFGLMRGDLSLRDDVRDTLKRSGFEPTSRDKEAIAKRAQEIYDQLSARRQELGLGEYDNQVPEGLENYFDFLTE